MPSTQARGIENTAVPGHKVVEANPDPATVGRLLRLLQPDLKRQKHTRGGHKEDLSPTGFQEKTLHDATEYSKQGGAMNPRAMARAAALIQHEGLKGFMDFDEGMEKGKFLGSNYLLVNGHDTTGEGSLSPLSFVSAQLYQLATAPIFSKQPFTLGYFCAMHRPFSVYGSETCQPTGMMVSLLGQLAGQMVERGIPVNLPLDDKQWRHIKKRKLDILGTVFSTLVEGLPRDSMVYCVIDEFTCYDQPDITEDLQTILQTLIDALKVCDKEDGPTFKLLVTTRRQPMSLEVRRMFRGHTVDLPAFVEVRDSSQAILQQFSRR